MPGKFTPQIEAAMAQQTRQSNEWLSGGRVSTSIPEPRGRGLQGFRLRQGYGAQVRNPASPSASGFAKATPDEPP